MAADDPVGAGGGGEGCLGGSKAAWYSNLETEPSLGYYKGQHGTNHGIFQPFPGNPSLHVFISYVHNVPNVCNMFNGHHGHIILYVHNVNNVHNNNNKKLKKC